MHKELFLRKRSRKGLLGGPTATNVLDFDFNLGTIESESDSSGDETYLVATSKDRAKLMKKSKFEEQTESNSNGGQI